MQTRAVAALPELKALTAHARGLLLELDGLGKDLEEKLLLAMEKAWSLGKVLVQIKARVGHGNWLVWMGANLEISERHARRHMELANENPDATRVEELSAESVRKFRLGYVPEKEPAELSGNVALPRVCHHLTMLNDWRRFQRRVEIGQVQFDPDEAKRDLAPLARWILDLYGIQAELSA